MQLRPLLLSDEEAVRSFVASFHNAGEGSIPAFFRHPAWSHSQLVEIHEGWSEGIDRSPPDARLFDDAVPCTTRFLVEEETGKLHGVVNVRHRLNAFLERFGGHIGYSVRPSSRRRGHATRLLRAGLEIARSHGHDRVIVTCDATNLGSIRTIERCGGVLAESFFHETMKKDVRLFWIDTGELPNSRGS